MPVRLSACLGASPALGALFPMTFPSDFTNDHDNGGLPFSYSTAKNFLTKSIFMYLMVGSVIPS
jgi:hypothetical protein